MTSACDEIAWTYNVDTSDIFVLKIDLGLVFIRASGRLIFNHAIAAIEKIIIAR